jgi:aspergillopepsin I
MPSLRSVATLSLLAGLSAASPIEAQGSFKLKQVHMGYAAKSPAKSMANTYAKFGGTMPFELAQAAANNSTGSVPTKPGDAHDSLYLTPVNVGGTTLMLDFDTGSADLWVFSSELPASKSAGHAVYKPDTSKKMSGASWSISYGDGSSASGDVYKDTVTVGGVAVDGQAVEAAKTISAQFASDKKNDGLLGLAFSSINTVSPTAQTTWFDTAVKAGDLKQSVFAAKLEHQKPGSYDFGFIDDSAYTGSLAYTDVDNSQGFWSLTTDGYAVGTKTSQTAITGIADTGTTLIYVPKDVVSAYYNQVSSATYNSQQGGYTFDCDADLPDFSLIINGEKRTTPGSYVNYAPLSGNTCFGGIQRNDGLQGLSIFGDIFLKSQYVVFDSEGPKIGFAPQA